MVKKIQPVEKPTKLNVLFKGNPVVREDYKGKFKREDIKEYAQAKSNALKAKNFDGIISVSLLFPGRGWRSGYFTPVGDKIRLYNLDSYQEDEADEPESFTEFQIYYVKSAPKAGGCSSKYNDCLYYCLKDAMREHHKFNNPMHLKKVLGLKRYDKVPIECIQSIDDHIKTFKINVSGDHTYTSTKADSRVINLKLIDGHYKLVHDDIKVHGVSYKEKIPLIYKHLENGYYPVYDKFHGKRLLDVQTFNDIKKRPIESEFILIPADSDSDSSIKDQYDAFIKDAETLKQESNGLINLYKTGSNVKTALHLFNHFNNTITAEPIKQVEGEWIQKASFAALIFADKYNGPCYKYDVCSHYPSLMSHKLMYFPIKEGTFKKLETVEFTKLERLPYGIYRCIVEHRSDVYKEFRYNKFNYYTHIDLGVARELGLLITMIDDNHPNQLLYKRSDLVTGNQLFKPYFEYLFKLKDKKVPRAKAIINILWGALTQKNIIKMVIKNDDDKVVDIVGDKTVTKIYPRNDNETNIEFYKNDSLFETNYGRIGPFVLARGRQLIRKFMKQGDPTLEHIHYAHTDGFISSKKLDVQTGNAMGSLKYEGYCEDAIITNCIKVTNTNGEKKNIFIL